MNNLKSLIYALVAISSLSFAQEKPLKIQESIEIAKSVPIADVHMHTVDRSTSFHKDQMDRNNVKWGGGVGPTGKNPPNTLDIQSALSSRYFFGLGQAEFTQVFFSAGAEGLTNQNSRAFMEMFKVADYLLESRKAYGFGEIHIDNNNSASSNNFRRKITFDNPVVRTMYEIANKHSSFIQIHMEADEANIAALKKYLSEFPNVSTVLSHGLPYGKPTLIRELLEMHHNIYFELSRKGAVLNKKEVAQAFSTRNGVKEIWLKSIELYPDRFMIGSDTHYPDESRYDDVMQEFRDGLFPYLQPETLKKVAYQNAVKVFRLTE
jgi:predicted TIM-barrel fold metal-dependent hydrolase